MCNQLHLARSAAEYRSGQRALDPPGLDRDRRLR
jgi:hypothetical protein